MTPSVPPKGSARPEERASGQNPRHRALEALSELAALAAGVCNAPAALIHLGQGEDRHAVAAFGNETGEDFPTQTVILVSDQGGRALGTLTLLDREVTEVSAHQSRILSGLARQAAALLELGGDLVARAAPIEDQFHDILELIPDAILMHAKGRLTYVNSAMVKLSGAKDAGALLGKSIGALFAPEAREVSDSYVEDLYQKGLPTARRAFRYRRQDGREIPLELASLPLSLRGEEFRLVVARDMSGRMEAAETLRESEARFQTFMDYSPLMAWIKDENNKFLYVNRGMQETFKLPAEKSDAGTYFENGPGTRKQEVDRTDRLVLEQGKALEYTEKFPTPDGAMRTWWVSKFPFAGRGGQRLIGGISLDITEKEKAEARIRVFADIFRNIQVGVFVWQLEGPLDQARFRLLATNAAASRMTSMSIDDVIGKTMQEAFPGVYDLGLSAKCVQVIADGESCDLGEIAYGDTRMPAGYYSAKIIPLPNDTIAVAFENVTEERRNREVLRQSVERFELIARATNDAVWEWKPATGETWWNERLYQLFGLAPGGAAPVGGAPVGGAPVGGAPSMDAWKERLHPEDRESVLASFRKIGEGGADTWVREYRVRRPDGTDAWIYERGYAVRGPDGAPERMLGAMLDITDLKRAEDAVRESEDKYRKLVEVLPDVIAIIVDGRMTFVNQAGLQLHGAKDSSEVLGRPVLDFFHPDSHQAVIERLRQLDQGLEIPPMEHKFLRKDGTAFEAESRAITFPFQGHRAKLAVVRDITARKQTELALRASEERYRLLFLNNPQPMWLHDTDTFRFLDVNEAAIARYGWTREEFLARSLRDIWMPEDAHALEEASRDLARKRSASEVRRHRRKDGSIIHAEVFHHYIEFPGKGAALALANDITDKLEALERLRHSEERYRTLAAVSPVGLYRTDIQGRGTYANDHLCGLLGARPEELIGAPVTQAIHPADRKWVDEAWQSAVARGLPFHAEYRLQSRGNRTVWVMGNALADKAPDGTTIGFVGTVSDITERKQAEILLACQKRTLAMVASGFQLQDVLDSLVQSVEAESAGGMGAVLLLDGESGRLAWSAAANLPAAFRSEFNSFPVGADAGALGLSASSRDYTVCPDIGSDAAWSECREAALAHGLRACASRPIIGSRGEPLGVFAFFYPHAGEPAGYDLKLMETASDLAAIAIERQRQEEVGRMNQELSEQNLRILEASRMKSEFLANMSHELRTPLNAIIGFSQLLIDRKVGPMNDKQSEYMGDILDGGMHLLRLINDVLDLAKIEAGKMQLHCEEISVAQAMREVCDILMPMAQGKGVTVRHAAGPGAEVAWLDGRKVRQVLYNLVSNAIKFSRNGGEVEVLSASDDRGGILLQVKDQGIGIRREDLGKLFQQFQQLDSGSARHYPGTGLGLVITKKLVELHQGTVEVESDPGVGSTFTAYFPYHRPGID